MKRLRKVRGVEAYANNTVKPYRGVTSILVYTTQLDISVTAIITH